MATKKEDLFKDVHVSIARMAIKICQNMGIKFEDLIENDLRSFIASHHSFLDEEVADGGEVDGDLL